MRDDARLLMTAHRRLEPAIARSPSARGLHSWICDLAPDGMKLGPNRGQRTHSGLESRGSNPYEFTILGQVGEESHRRPLVVEPAAAHSGKFSDVHERAEKGQFRGCIVSGHSPTFVGVGVNRGSRTEGGSRLTRATFR